LPAFSDDNWISLGGSPGANNPVNASVVDASGNLYIGGSFIAVGDTKANFIAKWNGSIWSALGSGVNGIVSALAVSGSDLYAGGTFTSVGGVSPTGSPLPVVVARRVGILPTWQATSLPTQQAASLWYARRSAAATGSPIASLFEALPSCESPCPLPRT
jgi:hypothetical protein